MISRSSPTILATAPKNRTLVTTSTHLASTKPAPLCRLMPTAPALALTASSLPLPRLRPITIWDPCRIGTARLTYMELPRDPKHLEPLPTCRGTLLRLHTLNLPRLRLMLRLSLSLRVPTVAALEAATAIRLPLDITTRASINPRPSARLRRLVS